jgi:hypothetical protein
MQQITDNAYHERYSDEHNISMNAKVMTVGSLSDS